MPVSPARAAAFDILLRVDQHDAYASELLHSRQYAKLSSADHSLTTELVMGVLRWRSLLDREITRVCSQKLERLDPEVLLALRLAAYQIIFLDRVPQRAAVHESVELVKRARKRSAVPFANAVLRKLANQISENRGGPAIEAATSVAELSERLHIQNGWSNGGSTSSAIPPRSRSVRMISARPKPQFISVSPDSIASSTTN